MKLSLTKIFEAVIGRLVQNIKIVFQLDKTKHAAERQNRDNEFISDFDMKEVAEKALSVISKKLMFNELDIGDQILIRDSKTHLNLIGAIDRAGNSLELVIITVMRKLDFKPKSGTKIIEV